MQDVVWPHRALDESVNLFNACAAWVFPGACRCTIEFTKASGRGPEITYHSHLCGSWILLSDVNTSISH